MSDLVLSAAQVGELLEYRKPNGAGNGETIRDLYRNGNFPPPIDKDQPAVRWRWSRVVVERYVAGEWPWPKPRLTFNGAADQVLNEVAS